MSFVKKTPKINMNFNIKDNISKYKRGQFGFYKTIFKTIISEGFNTRIFQFVFYDFSINAVSPWRKPENVSIKRFISKWSNANSNLNK